jgi:asparagine synthase (glutamine-hydrolysing)
LQEFDPVAWITELSEPLPQDPKNALALVESVTYLRNQLLRDSDWASMAHSVELRTPLVDAWLLRQLRPVVRAFGDFPDKRLLAQAPAFLLPGSVIARRKTGFSIPVQSWLQQIGVTTGGGMSKNWAQKLVKAGWAN